jgi:homogentisate 1,2-dioxygenase
MVFSNFEDNSWSELKYIDGFGSYVTTEALPGALPVGQNSPQVCPYGLYSEQLSGSAFTAPRVKNFRSWLYRIRPSVVHDPFTESEVQKLHEEFEKLVITPNQLRWDPLAFPSDTSSIDFVDGLQLVAGAGDPSLKEGMSIYNYAINSSMVNRAFNNSDGELLIVPQVGTLYITTELGKMKVDPCEIVVIPRGVRFSVEITEESRGYVAEVFKGRLELPNLGPIGANGLASPRDFQTPVAFFEDQDTHHEIVNKYMNKFFVAPLDHSPFDVVAWHGNYGPYKYDLRKFNCMNTVTFDHPDPSIYTVLTIPSGEFVI